MRDGSDSGVERLTQLLREYARADLALPRRPPANDNLPLGGFADDMHNRLEALRLEPLTDLDPDEPFPRVAPAPLPGDGSLEELVAVALGVAQQAEDLARDASEIVRRNRYGVTLAVAITVIGMVIASAGAISARLGHRTDSGQRAEIARQAQALNALQRHVDDQFAQIQAHAPVREANATQVTPGAAPSSASDTQVAAAPSLLGPLKTVPVRVLPAEAAPPDATPPDQLDTKTWTPYHARVRHYRATAFPRPAAFVIGGPVLYRWGMYR